MARAKRTGLGFVHGERGIGRAVQAPGFLFLVSLVGKVLFAANAGLRLV